MRSIFRIHFSDRRLHQSSAAKPDIRRASAYVACTTLQTDGLKHDKAATARNMALDPALSPDTQGSAPQQWRESASPRAAEDYLPRLQARCREVQAQEYLARWRGEFENLKVKRDRLAEELRAIYPKFEAKIADLFKHP